MTISNVTALNSAVFATVTDRRLSVDEADIVPRSNVIPPAAEVSANEKPNQEQLPNRFTEQSQSRVQGRSLAGLEEPEAGQVLGSESADSSNGAVSTTTVQTELTDQQQELVRDLAARDREVRAHEAAHANTGGQFAGAVSLTFERGPDGQNYAVAGEVPIDISAAPNDPSATIAKAQIVRRAALAPSQPSAADRAIAAQATALEQQAVAELAAEVVESNSSTDAGEPEQSTNTDIEQDRPEPSQAQRRVDLFASIAAGSSDPASAQQSIDIII